MLTHYLTQAISDIDNLIDLTKEDIENIKEAKHQKLSETLKIKEELIASFESKKALIDHQLVKKVEQEKDKELEKLLVEKEKELLNQLQNKLNELKIINKEYARFVVSVGEFYNSLFDKLFPSEIDGYKKSNPKTASIIEEMA